jgi:hypothetical protein
MGRWETKQRIGWRFVDVMDVFVGGFGGLEGGRVRGWEGGRDMLV